MMIRPNRSRAWLLVAALCPVLALCVSVVDAATGYYLEEELTRIGAGAERSTLLRTWMVAGKLRKEDGAQVTIMREDRGLLWVLDPGARTYYELDDEQMAKMNRASLQAVFPDGPEDAGDWLKRTGKSKKVGRYQAYEVRVDDRPLPGVRLSLWLSEDVPIDPELRGSFGGQLFGGSAAAELLAGLRELPGYPVEVTMTLPVGDRRLQLRQRLRSVEPGEFEDQRFEVPADYRRVPPPFTAEQQPETVEEQ